MASVDTDTVTVVLPSNQEKASTHYGLVAKELQDAYPELVKEGQDGYLNINYIELVPLLIQSIQELKSELDEVKGTVKAKLSDGASAGAATSRSQYVGIVDALGRMARKTK